MGMMINGVPVFGSLYVGNYPSGYTSFDPDGTQVSNGNAITWDDLAPIPLLSQRQGGANNPSLTAFQGNIQLLTFAVNDYVYINAEITHAYKEGTNITIHVHWILNGTEGVDKAVKWELEYSISNAKFFTAPFNLTFPANTTVSVETTIPAGSSDKCHIVTSLGTISGTGITIGAYIVGRFRRIASAGTAPAANPFAVNLGFHIEQDTQGSREIATK